MTSAIYIATLGGGTYLPDRAKQAAHLDYTASTSEPSVFHIIIILIIIISLLSVIFVVWPTLEICRLCPSGLYSREGHGYVLHPRRPLCRSVSCVDSTKPRGTIDRERLEGERGVTGRGTFGGDVVNAILGDATIIV